jgi:hypothetical protein
MADSKISALPAASVALAGTEVLPIVQSSATKQVTVANLTAGRAVATGALTVTGDATLSTGNIVQGTAAKGINFTANTPAAGSSSQLLNWYEEGNWTPTYTGWSVDPTTAAATYTRIGRQVTLNMICQGGTSTGSGVSIGGIPFNSSALGAGTGRGHDIANSSVGFNCLVWNGASIIQSISAATFGTDYWSFTATYFV